ncbi:MAG: transketolase family protein [Chitinophagales bacterium]|jgi:transketolase|nr:transketolase family protein [Chitinophagales bacterium]
MYQIKDLLIRGQKDTRSGFGDAMAEMVDNEKIVALCADLTGSLKLDAFKEKAPNRFFQAGIAEQNMIGVAAGLSLSGLIPFATTFANFATARVYDQIRQSIAYSKTNVKICASHAGITLGEDGATHQIMEDIGLMQMLPHFIVINPCDYYQTYQATKAIALTQDPTYLRFGRPVLPVFIPENAPFEIGKALKLNDGKDITIVATGHLVWEAVQAIEILEKEGISCDLLNIHTIKPLDLDAILASVKKTGKILVCEEHQRLGGLTSTIALNLSEIHPTPLKSISMMDTFGESGTPNDLMKKYGLSSENIVKTIQSWLAL